MTLNLKYKFATSIVVSIFPHTLRFTRIDATRSEWLNKSTMSAVRLSLFCLCFVFYIVPGMFLSRSFVILHRERITICIQTPLHQRACLYMLDRFSLVLHDSYTFLLYYIAKHFTSIVLFDICPR